MIKYNTILCKIQIQYVRGRISNTEKKSRSCFEIIYFPTNTKKTLTIHSDIRQLFLLGKCLLSEKIVY